MNRVVLMGRLTRDIEVKYSNETAVTHFTLAVDRRVKSENGPSADFVSCVAFNKQAEFLEKFGRQGTKFVLEGRLQTGSYTGREGNKVYTTDVAVDGIEFAESKASNDAAHNEAAGNEDAGFMDIPDIPDDLPFK